MSLLPQPPPDEPASPPGREALRSRRKMNLIWWLGVISIGFLFLLMSAPVVLMAKKATARTEAINNMKQIGAMLIEFDTEYGSYPDASTVTEVRKITSTVLTLDDSSSNKLFRQLLVYQKGSSEKPFFAKIDGSRKPDDAFGTDATALQKGECGFAYITGLNSSGEPAAPVVMSEMLRGRPLFEAGNEFLGKAIVLRLDNSATALQIDPGGRVIAGSGGDLLDPSQPYWKGKAPNIKWQE